MAPPTVPESYRDLLDAPIGTLATIGPDGRPQLSCVWFLGEGDTVSTSLNEVRQKVKNLQKNPACAMIIVDPKNPFRYLEIRGDAEVADDPDYAFVDKESAKYQVNLRQWDAPGEKRVRVTIKPTRILGLQQG